MTDYDNQLWFISTRSCAIHQHTIMCNNEQMKTAFCKHFRHRNSTSFHSLPGGRFPWNLNTKRELVSSWILLEQDCKIFSERGSFTPETSILGFFGTLLRERFVNKQIGWDYLRPILRLLILHWMLCLADSVDGIPVMGLMICFSLCMCVYFIIICIVLYVLSIQTKIHIIISHLYIISPYISHLYIISPIISHQ